MLLWFVGTAVVAVWFVFTDPRFDYRLLIVGSLVPAVVDGIRGSTGVVHSLMFSVALLALVMVVTHGRRPIRSMLLGLPVGTLLHLVFTGAWTRPTAFWWPFLGGLDDAPTPIASRGWWNLVLEAIGLVLCVWVVRTARLTDRSVRAEFLRTGRLDLPRR